MRMVLPIESQKRSDDAVRYSQEQVTGYYDMEALKDKDISISTDGHKKVSWNRKADIKLGRGNNSRIYLDTSDA